jgi:hypothetical protein
MKSYKKNGTYLIYVGFIKKSNKKSNIFDDNEEKR